MTNYHNSVSFNIINSAQVDNGCPVLVAGTSKDMLHIKEEIHRMVEMIPDCRYIDLETNLRSHSAEMGQVVQDYVHSLT